MYFIVGKTINQNKQIISYLITDGNSVGEVTPLQVYIEYQKGNLLYLKGFNTNTGEVDFKNIDNSLLPTFYNGRGINNNASVLKILEESNKQTGVRILVASGEIMNVSLSDIIKLVNGKKIQLFNAKIVNNKVVMKYADTTVTKIRGRGNKEEVTINNYDKSKFIIDDNLRLIKYTGNDKEVIIPKGVTSIEKNAFCGCKSLTSIDIPDSVTSIGDNAFCNCTSLTSITIPDSVTSIGAAAFWGCRGLTSINIPDSVTSIGYGAFCGCTIIESITIPDSVITIVGLVFAYWTSLQTIYIKGRSSEPSGWNKYWNENCDAKIVWDTESDNASKSALVPLVASGNCGKDGDNVKWQLDYKGLLVISGSGEMSNYTRASGAPWVEIQEYIEVVIIKKGVTSIGDGAFWNCTNLLAVMIPDSVMSIGDAAFYGCPRLTSVIIPDSVKSIGNYAFDKCARLTSVMIPDSVTSIGDYTFYKCQRLYSVTIPDSVTSIGDKAFAYCYSLTSVTIGNSVTSIGEGAFTETTFFETDTRDFVIYGKVLYAYQGTQTEVVIPDSVTSIGDYAFAHCTRLRSITIPDSITNIGKGAFLNCTSLTSIIIPDSVESVGKHAFRYWTSSQTIYIKDVSFVARERSKDWNYECEAKIVLDDESDNRIVAFGNCGKDGDNVIWQLDDKGLLVISGDGKMEDFSITSDIPWWHEKRESIKTVIIKEGVTSIGSSVFACHTNLRSITIPDSVTSIGACAFYYCGNLTSINISDSVTSIGNWAFEGCLNICIIGGHGSTVEKYAMDYNIKFEYEE